MQAPAFQVKALCQSLAIGIGLCNEGADHALRPRAMRDNYYSMSICCRQHVASLHKSSSWSEASECRMYVGLCLRIKALASCVQAISSLVNMPNSLVNIPKPLSL